MSNNPRIVVDGVPVPDWAYAHPIVREVHDTYYDNNIEGTRRYYEAMQTMKAWLLFHGVKVDDRNIGAMYLTDIRTGKEQGPYAFYSKLYMSIFKLRPDLFENAP